MRRPDLRVSARNGYYGEVEGGYAGSQEDRINVSPDGSRSRAVKEALGEASTPPPGKSARAPEQTFEEAKYLKQLIENPTPVRVKLEDGEEVVGIIEYYDQSFIRLTRKGEANLFIFKHDIKYLIGRRPKAWRYLETAVEIAREAGALLANYFERRVAFELKGDFDLVTEADRASEKLVVERLRTHFPSPRHRGRRGRRAREPVRIPLVCRSAGRHHQLRPQLSRSST